MRVKNLFLLAASLLFYAWGGIYYLLIMLLSIGINYFGGYRIYAKGPSAKSRKWILAVIITLNIGLLFFFKYFNMLVVILEAIIARGGERGKVLEMILLMEGTGELGINEIVLPIGISFFTFQAMSYVIDVYRDRVPAQKNILDFGLYVSLFPQLIAGPIVRYCDVVEDIKEREESVGLFYSGVRKFCYGLGKKVLLANTFATVVDSVWKMNVSTIGTPLAWFGIFSYTLQIYYDFSGYSDMAIGIGRMLGFRFRENFNYPYTSLSVQEFWRRWHISLSEWFKEYVYIPLGGNRKGQCRTYLNLLIVFLLTGLWHGANFTFLVWGIFHGVILVIERIFLGKLLNKNPFKLLNWLYTMLVVMIGWVYFRSDNILYASEYVRQMFGSFSSNYGILSLLSMKVLLAFAFAIPCSGIQQRFFGEVFHRTRHSILVQVVDLVIQMMSLSFSILALVGDTYNPFLYFQF